MQAPWVSELEDNGATTCREKIIIVAYHSETVPCPETPPPSWTLWNLLWLAVNRKGLSGSLTHSATTDIWVNLLVHQGHHGKGLVGGQPVGAVIAAGVVADVVEVAEEEGHGAETLQARASVTCKDFEF